MGGGQRLSNTTPANRDDRGLEGDFKRGQKGHSRGE